MIDDGRKAILAVEDDKNLLATLQFNLTAQGYHVLTASDGATTLNIARENDLDLIILDLSLPILGGMDVCRALRDDGNTVPILMLTAWHDEASRVEGLECGADDYVTKPFSLRELMARVGSQLRRADMAASESNEDAPAWNKERSHTIGDGALKIDLMRRTVWKNEEGLTFRPREFDLLVYLATQPGRVFTRQQILQEVWGRDFPGGARTIDVHVSWIRRKIEDDPADPQILVTVRGVGYRLMI